MKNVLTSFAEAGSIFRKDKWVFVLSLVPVLIGIAIFTYLGKWLYGDALSWGQALIKDQVAGGWLSAISGVMILFLTVVFYFLINWTFVLAISFFAAPFNDMISSRVEKIIDGESPPEISESFKLMMGRLAKTIINECKKLLTLLTISIIGFALSFFFPPAAFILSALLYAINFVDYSWSRHEFQFRNCMKDASRSFIPYTLSGGLFLALVSIPVVNLFLIPFSTVYYTVLFVREEKAKKYIV